MPFKRQVSYLENNTSALNIFCENMNNFALYQSNNADKIESISKKVVKVDDIDNIGTFIPS